MHLVYADEKEYHIGLGAGEAGKYVLLTGDPKRCSVIAQHLEGAVQMADRREFVTYTGLLEGERVSVTSTGIGGPSAAIAMEELVHLGAHTFLRIGTCGGMATQVCGNDLVIASGAIRMEGTSREYAPIEFPAVAHPHVVRALEEAAHALGKTAHVGVVACKDSFYGQHEPQRKPVGQALLYKWNAWIQAGALASEMESAALFVVASCLRVRAGTVLHVCANQERRAAGLDDPVFLDPADAVTVAVEGLRRLILADRAAEKNA